MTLIAMIETESGPALFGDLMLSDKVGNRRIHLPSIGDVTDDHLVEGDPFTPINLLPKLAIINPRLAIAWAGYRWFAHSLVSTLVAIPDTSALSPDEITALIRNIVLPFGHFGTCFAIIRHGDKVRYAPIGPHEYTRLKGHGLQQAWVAGSGTSLFLKTLGSTKNAINFNDRQANSLAALSTLPALMLKAELFTLGPVQASFGGAYETIVNSECGFSYHDQFPIMFWAHEIADDGTPLFRVPPYRVIHLTHYYGAPIIWSFEMRDPTGKNFEVTRTEFHTIAPLSPLKPKDVIWPPTADKCPLPYAPGVIHAFAIRRVGTQNAEVFSIMLSSSDGARGGVSFTVSPLHDKLMVSPEFIARAKVAIRDTWQLMVTDESTAS
ncbi:MAG: hypothetical protein WD768_06320 [Phycisphaeraceae bacterium]